jgi:hypothetical protein
MAVSKNNFINLNDSFFSDVKKRFTDPQTGALLDSEIEQRLSDPICQKCQARYKEKFPNSPFRIKCEGIYSDVNHQHLLEESLAAGVKTTFEEIKELYDPAYWASRYLVTKNANGDIVPFQARWYQAEMIRCTAARKVDRIMRGGGKTMGGIAEELWHLFTKKNFNTLVLCPGQVQSQLWYTEILFQEENSPPIAQAIESKKQQPFFQIKFKNGSSIGIFTAGSSSGKGATSVRGQSPDRVRLDEQDYLHDNDYNAVNALMRRKKHSTFHGSSTPTGFRSQFWKMCTQFDDYREFFYPINVHPDYNDEMEKRCLAEARTADVFRHEFLAEFGEPATGVFKNAFITPALKPYLYSRQSYVSTCRYFMGVDWNGKGTGTRICIVEYEPSTRIRRKVYSEKVDTESSTTQDSINAIIRLNKDWHCDEVFIDAGFGFAQDEFIRLAGQQADAGKDPDRARLRYVKSIDFGGSLELNKLVPNKTHPQKRTPDDEDTFEGRTKPFMVEGAVMAFEMGLVQLSNEDRALEEQLRAYRVTNYTVGGAPRTFDTDKEIGDHDLDAFMLALLAIELKYGLWHTPDTLKRVAQIAYTGGFGLGSSSGASENREVTQLKKGVSSRSLPTPKNEPNYRIAYLSKLGALIAPKSSSNNNSKVPSRTSVFGNKGSRSLN